MKSAFEITMFFTVLLVCAVCCTVVWDKLVADKLYNCTDAIGFDFLHPGHWIHGNYITVPQIVTGRSMSEPDTFKQGWSIPKLWLLWCSFTVTSVAVSALLTFLFCWRKKRSD